MSRVLGRLLQVASQQHGYVTVGQAASAGISPDQLRRMAASKTLERRSQGLYKICAVPFNEHSELIEAVLWARGEGLIGGPTAVALWDLADVNPRRIDLVIEPGCRIRRQGGGLYTLHAERVDASERDEIHGVPVVVASAAIRQSIDWGVPNDLIEQAVRRGVARELFSEETAFMLRQRRRLPVAAEAVAPR